MQQVLAAVVRGMLCLHQACLAGVFMGQGKLDESSWTCSQSFGHQQNANESVLCVLMAKWMFLAIESR